MNLVLAIVAASRRRLWSVSNFTPRSYSRLIGEVKQDCNLTINNGQEARGRRKWFLGGHFP
jgi:hypothetical protein